MLFLETKKSTKEMVFWVSFLFRKVSVGGKVSTEFVVKGIRKAIPQKLIDELKAICQSFYLLLIFLFWALKSFV